MNAAQNFLQLHMGFFEAFKAQDPVNGDFDVVFDIDGQKLNAHQFLLCSASETFKSMLSIHWKKTNDPVKVESYSFNDFKEFLTFVYSGECVLTSDNISIMVDIAEFYGVKVFKAACEKFLLLMKLDCNNIFQLYDLATKYSLSVFQYVVDAFFAKNLSSILKSEQFQSLPRETLKSIVAEKHDAAKQEELFESVYKWAEKLASENQNCNNVHEAIKEELIDILPFIDFTEMKEEFFIKVVVRKAFLFPGDELSNILWDRRKVHVTITDENGKLMKGELCCPDMDQVYDVIKSQKNKNVYKLFDANYCFWETLERKPSMPSKITVNQRTDWYLLYDNNLCNNEEVIGNLAIKHRERVIIGNYLLAEMYAENGFKISSKCKIYVHRNA